jgi:hypothetical protein
MVRESSSLQERRVQLQQHRAFKIAKTMAPNPSTYTLRSRGLPTMNVERSIRARKASTKISEKEGMEAIQVQAITKAVIEAFQPVINALTLQVAQLSIALEEQRAEFTAQINTLRTEIMTMIAMQSSNAQSPALAGTGSYAAVAAQSPPLGTPQPRSPPFSQPSNLASIPMSQTSAISETLYCTIDTSRVDENDKKEAQPGIIREAIEKEIRAKEGNQWRCAAVMRDSRNSGRIRVACRDEKEHKAVKEAAEKVKVQGARILRDQLFPIKVDGVNRLAVLDEHNQLRPEITDKLGKENEVQIAKLSWLSKKDNPKAYGSMVIYVTKGSDAKRLLHEQFFHVAGESGWTSAFERRPTPMQCYNCQEVGHKAFNCKKNQICAKCAQEGHHHKDCINDAIPKCVPCGGPHESFSRNCRILYPLSHE